MSGNNHPETSPRRPDGAALGVAVVLAVIAGVILWDAAHLAELTAYSPVGPATVPYVVAFGLLGLAVWTVFAAMRRDFPEREHQEIGPVIWIIGGLAAQMLLLKTAGFSIATGLLFAATAYAFGRRKLWISIPVGIVLSFVVWLIFARLLQLSLPAGPIERLFI
ncbi:hypothetical protein PDO_0135 [Rhizobium sp. PDO1-076]|uniref:tripartite tricarboxylate transporter TctB family protein n=2 Tax=Rhizobium TaxID=379 RepID=UPI00024E3780|nr:tripartite tricarboxylate transporter TctB family protein [Rhizobium sp. PDO1-076]EHS51381.1 hypothetical protein PDO_0135 [Rhizobium sp. PDO1-076]